jgi:radical SAM protein with 4Fe4S-binding SPASM domain
MFRTTAVTFSQFRKPPTLAGYTIDYNRAKEFRDNGSLLTMRLETSHICNLRCVYCNNSIDFVHDDEIPYALLQKCVIEARQLGAESVVVIGGGEPLMYPQIRELITDIYDNGMIPVIITNGFNLTEELCAFFFNKNVSLLLKCDSFNRKTQDYLCGQHGSHDAILKAIELVMDTGFFTPKSEQLRAGLSFVVTKINYTDILPIWKFCRKHNFFPNFEEFIPRGRGLVNYQELFLDNDSVFSLKNKLLRYDQCEHGYDWLIHSPLPGHGCLQPLCSVYITSSGDVRPCADIDVSYSNVIDTSISDIIKTPFFQLSRNIEKHLKGKCFSCEFGDKCIGCRGNAFSTGVTMGMSPEDALCSADPLCLK